MPSMLPLFLDYCSHLLEQLLQERKLRQRVLALLQQVNAVLQCCHALAQQLLLVLASLLAGVFLKLLLLLLLIQLLL